MTSIIYTFLSKIQSALSYTNKGLLRKFNPQYKIIEQWYKEDVHSLKRSSFDFLNSNSVVFDLGGYEGQWSSDLYSRYLSRIYVFEPVLEYYNLIKTRFANNPGISIFQFGLGAKDFDTVISLNKFASSVVREMQDGDKETISIKEFISFVTSQHISTIDLIKINIEGSEYELLDHLIQTQFIKNIKGILVQFHNFARGDIQKMQNVQNHLSLTHKPVFQYQFVWEYWHIK